ncbi:MAG TPA: hypothetical protein VK460_07325 [Burkholderiales bacterium]|nr:hypothetical protein [Burkholderiales bacterium]
MIIRILLLLSLTILAGCGGYSLVKPEQQDVDGALSVQPGMEWNKVSTVNVEGKIQIWTLDGPVLNRPIFFEGVGDGEALFKPRSGPFGSAKQDEAPPVFRSNMNPFEVQELIQATVARNFQTTIVECRNLKSAQFVGGPGFRFDTKFTARDEVERKGVFVGTVRGGKLYGLWFFGAGSHYFDRYLPEFNRLIGSAKIAETAASAK